MERRLNAILAADVVGYSCLMEANEEATALSKLCVVRSKSSKNLKRETKS